MADLAALVDKYDDAQPRKKADGSRRPSGDRPIDAGRATVAGS